MGSWSVEHSKTKLIFNKYPEFFINTHTQWRHVIIFKSFSANLMDKFVIFSSVTVNISLFFKQFMSGYVIMSEVKMSISQLYLKKNITLNFKIFLFITGDFLSNRSSIQYLSVCQNWESAPRQCITLHGTIHEIHRHQGWDKSASTNEALLLSDRTSSNALCMGCKVCDASGGWE